MAAFDIVRVVGPDRACFTCAADHAVTAFQTKDLGVARRIFYLYEGVLYSCTSAWEDSRPALREGLLHLRCTAVARRHAFSGTILLYSTCGQCAPIFVDASDQDSEASDAVQGYHPHVDYELALTDGRAQRLQPSRVQTRDQLRSHLARSGCQVLAEDDRVVLKALRHEHVEPVIPRVAIRPTHAPPSSQ